MSKQLGMLGKTPRASGQGIFLTAPGWGLLGLPGSSYSLGFVLVWQQREKRAGGEKAMLPWGVNLMGEINLKSRTDLKILDPCAVVGVPTGVHTPGTTFSINIHWIGKGD